jgi:putative membrane protein
LPVTAAPVVFFAVFASSGAVTLVIKALDPDSIISLRRMFGVAFAANLIWAIPFAAGSLFSWVVHTPQPSRNEFVLGAFFAWSFELLVVNGAFISSTLRSLCIAALQPIITLFLTSAFVIKVNPAVAYAAILGFVILGITTTFLLKFKTFKTEGVGINSLQTFQSFLKSWVSQKPANLEKYFTLYSQDELVTTRIVLAGMADKVALVLPGVHPGPFFPVGSYDLSELVYHELRKNGVVPMILHGVGGHERNLPTNELAKKYAAEIATIVTASGVGQKILRMRGPTKLKIGPTTVTTLGFGDKIVAFLSNAPYNTDDLDLKIVDGAASAAEQLGVELMLVDAHNSIGGENPEQQSITEGDWRRAFFENMKDPEAEFETGVAHSSELQFDHGSDISDGGVTVLVFKKQASKYVLVTSDSNNAVVGLRQRIIDELKRDDVGLIELCTSDTHKSAARYLTNRGYRALGEDSDRETLVATIKKLERLAEARLSRGGVAVITSQLTLPLIGDKPLNDFADLTKETLSFAKAYARAALASSLVICSLALFL